MNNQKKESIKKHTSLGVFSFLSMFLFIFLTNPASMPVITILVMPILIGVVTLSFIRLIMLIFFDISDQSMSLLSNSVAVSVLLVFMLGSLKQLGLQDLVLVLLLVFGVSFYLKRSSRNV